MRSVIYKAENKINGKIYIGKTANKFNERKQNHISQAKRGSNFYFHKALIKYGIENFEWEILCQCDDKNKLNLLEKFYITAYKKTYILYNMTEGGEGVCGRIVSDETRRKISEANKGQVPWIAGKKHSEEYKENMSKARKGKIPPKHVLEKLHESNRGRKHSEEHKKKISEAGLGRTASDSTKIKLSESKKGDKNPAKREEVRLKISESVKKYYREKKLNANI